MKKKEVIMIGGDTRQRFMAAKLLEYGYEVSGYGEVFQNALSGMTYLNTVEAVWEKLEKKGSFVVFPVPVTTDGTHIKGTGNTICISDICPHMKEKEKIYGGNIPKGMRADCEMKQGQCMDFMKSDRIAILNAVSTAEGAIAEACALGSSQLTGSQCLVIGYGRCGEILADKLSKFGADVTVMARREGTRARARAYGLSSCSFQLEEAKPDLFSYIFNTVPDMIVDKKFLKMCNQDVAIIDIASAPGGVDFEYAKVQGIAAKLCLGLPGKYAPKTAGEILAEEIRKEKEQS